MLVSDLLEVLEAQAVEKAAFCLRTNTAPSEYDKLTGIETAAFIAEHNKQQKEANRK